MLLVVAPWPSFTFDALFLVGGTALWESWVSAALGALVSVAYGNQKNRDTEAEKYCSVWV